MTKTNDNDDENDNHSSLNFNLTTQKLPPLGEGRGGGYTLLSPLTPFETGCKPSVYRGFAPLHP